jgi:hypothetical protein
VVVAGVAKVIIVEVEEMVEEVTKMVKTEAANVLGVVVL